MDEREQTLVEVLIHIEDHSVNRVAYIKSELRKNWFFKGWYLVPHHNVLLDGEDVVLSSRGTAPLIGDRSPEKLCKELAAIAQKANGEHCGVGICYRMISPGIWTHVETK